MLNTVKLLSATDYQWQNILELPQYLLHSINETTGHFHFINTSREQLSKSSFIDGRSQLSSESDLVLPIEDCLEWQQHNYSFNKPNRYIFHMSFCGSTLMARVLDIDEKVFSYKEPQILLQLAEMKSAQSSYYRNKITWESLLSFVLGQFNKQWSVEQKNIIKPSSWLNSMLFELLLDGGPSKAIFLSINRNDFLTAVFRGGGERIQFVYSLLKHMCISYPEYSQLITKIENENLGTEDLFARITLITHAIQTKAFKRAKLQLVDNDQYSCNYEEFVGDKIACVSKVNKVLELDLTRNELEKSLVSNFSNHSKIYSRSVNQHEIKQVNEQISNRYQCYFDRALHWADNELNPAH